MTAPKFKKVLSIICRNLSDNGVPHALIGAMALALYGIPRYTADIDLLCESRHRETIKKVLTRLGYTCFQDESNFAQFDSELGAYGKIDFLFVNTDEGRSMIEQRELVEDETLGLVPVIQPTDYAVLKLMAIANNPTRTIQDSADLETLLRASANELISPRFKPIDINQLKLFAERFGVAKQFASLLSALGETFQ